MLIQIKKLLEGACYFFLNKGNLYQLKNSFTKNSFYSDRLNQSVRGCETEQNQIFGLILILKTDSKRIICLKPNRFFEFKNFNASVFVQFVFFQ